MVFNKILIKWKNRDLKKALFYFFNIDYIY